MSDELVKRLRFWADFGYGAQASKDLKEAADLLEARRAVGGQQETPSEFEAHGELDAYGWTPFVFPDKQYFMKCCDCGLVHEMEFAAVETEPTDFGFYSYELPWPDSRVRFKVRRAKSSGKEKKCS